MSKGEFFDKYKTQMMHDQRKLKEKFSDAFKPRRQPNDDQIQTFAGRRVAAQPQGNLTPRRQDRPELILVPPPARGNNGPN